MTQNSVLDHFQPMWHLLDSDEAGKTIILCDYLQGRKRWGTTNYFLCVAIDHGWHEFQLKY